MARCSFDFERGILFEFYSFRCGLMTKNGAARGSTLVCLLLSCLSLFTLARTALNNRVNSRKKIIKFHGREGEGLGVTFLLPRRRINSPGASSSSLGGIFFLFLFFFFPLFLGVELAAPRLGECDAIGVNWEKTPPTFSSPLPSPSIEESLFCVSLSFSLCVCVCSAHMRKRTPFSLGGGVAMATRLLCPCCHVTHQKVGRRKVKK